jgi:N-acyl amino acid synthase of PEP-CTERM/exosortase system
MTSLSTAAQQTAQIFSEHFTLTLADDGASRDRVARLRHQVYCKELGFQLNERDGRETDHYDDHSLHCLLHHKPSRLDAGCIRLVLPLERGGGLPFEACGARYIDRTRLDWTQFDPRRCCEVSRLAMAPAFRRHLAEIGGEIGGNRLPMVSMALYHAVIALILERGYDHIFMVNELRLQRLLQRLGIRLQQISPDFDYFGRRAIFYTDPAQLRWEIDHWRSDWRALYDEVCRQLLGREPLVAPLEMAV